MNRRYIHQETIKAINELETIKDILEQDYFLLWNMDFKKCINLYEAINQLKLFRDLIETNLRED